MYIITNSKNVIEYITETLEVQSDRYIIDGNTAIMKEYRTQYQDGTIEVDTKTSYEVEIPEGIEVEKYCYTENDGFYKNPDYKEPEPPIEDQISEIEAALCELAEMIVGGNE